MNFRSVAHKYIEVHIAKTENIQTKCVQIIKVVTHPSGFEQLNTSSEPI